MTTATVNPLVHAIFDPATWTVTYVVYEKPGSACAIIDSVLDYDPKSGRTSHASADKVIEFVKTNKLKVEWILETHAHADHLTAAPYLKQHLGGKTAIGDHIGGVQKVFKGIFNMEADFKPDGSQFDHLFADGETISVGGISGHTMFVPGHTPAHRTPDGRSPTCGCGSGACVRSRADTPRAYTHLQNVRPARHA